MLADQRPLADLGVRHSVAGESRDLSLLRGELFARFDGAFADALAGGRQFALGASGERLNPHHGEHLERGAQRVAGVDAASFAPQPLAVEQVGAGQVYADVQASLGVDYGLYASASQFNGPQWISCQSFKPDSRANTNVTEFCDPQVDATLHSALAAESAGSPNGSAVWAKADRQITDEAPFVNLVIPSTVDFVSRRVRNYQYNPVQGVLIDQLWVR